MIKDNCEVVAFIDKKQVGKMINTVPVVYFHEYNVEKDIPYVVTAVYDFQNICNTIREYDKDALVISLEDIIETSAKV